MKKFIVLFVAILVVINLLSEQFFFRLDLTEEQQYTLSDATKDILRDLDEPITVKAYFSKDLPADGTDVCGMAIGPENRTAKAPAGCK